MNMCFLPSESTLMPRSFKLYAYGSSSGHYFITSLIVKKCLFSATQNIYQFHSLESWYWYVYRDHMYRCLFSCPIDVDLNLSLLSWLELLDVQVIKLYRPRDVFLISSCTSLYSGLWWTVCSVFWNIQLCTLPHKANASISNH